MLCPEVWDFPPPAAVHQFKWGNFSEDSTSCDKLINLHHFNHLISVVIPNTSTVPDSLTSVLNVDSDYYKIQKVNIAEFVNKEFIESFVKEGHLTVLSDGSRIDVEDCMCITSNGQLVLNVLRETYLGLGLEGTPSSFSSGTPKRYMVTIDLCSPSFTPGKKNYTRTQEALRSRLPAFDVLLVWEPPGQNVCPSSVASYFHTHGYSVLLCQQKVLKRSEQKAEVPTFPFYNKEEDPQDRNEDAENLLEWLGAFSLQGDITTGSPDNYLNCYEPPSPTVTCNDVLLLEWRGFFSVQKIHHFYTQLRKFIEENSVSPWASLHIQGFADSSLSWGKQEHTFFTDGDNHYTLFLHPSRYLTCTVYSSSRRPRCITLKKKLY